MTENTTSDILISVCMITYNHENFISQAIEGVVTQITSFGLELVVGEDCSTDKTREICIQYKEKYPNIIKLNLPEKNVGPQANFINTIALCKGKYVALCEGDDYWTDPYKLQKQVDFLEKNPDYAMSAHNSIVLGHNKTKYYDPPLNQNVFTTEDIISRDWSIMTASIVFLKQAFIIPDWFISMKSGDYTLQLLLSLNGKINYIPEYMSVYRKHLGGLTAAFNPFYSVDIMYSIFNHFNRDTNGKYKKLIDKKIQRIYKSNRKTAKDNNLKRQFLGLSLIYYFSKMGINAYPCISKISFFKKN